MIEKPNIRDEKIITALNEKYSIQVSKVEFLPIGNDSSAFSYRVETNDGILYFLKLKTDLSNLAGLFVPRFLKENGIEQVVAPLPARTQRLAEEVDGFHLILYPFISGTDAMKVGMSDDQWTELGSVLKQLHSTRLPSEISRFVRQEGFVPKWAKPARELQQQIDVQHFDDAYQNELAAFWKGNKETIRTVIERAEKIGRHLQQADLEFVLCHADIHTANILITPGRDMFIVDWDDTLFAPKERDFMFVLIEDTIRTREEQIFFDGYGMVKFNQQALAYYRCEWCVQEIGDFGARVFSTRDVGESTRSDALDGFIKLFSQGDVIDAALNTSFDSEIRNHS